MTQKVSVLDPRPEPHFEDFNFSFVMGDFRLYVRGLREEMSKVRGLGGGGKYPEILAYGGKHSFFARAFGARGFSVPYYTGRWAQKHAAVSASLREVLDKAP